MQIRGASGTDLPEILAIFNDVIATSTAIYRDAPTTLEERKQWLESRVSAGFPVFVATANGKTVGFSTFGEFRGSFSGYRHTVEHSVHVAAAARGLGVGTALVEALFRPARDAGKHVMIGAIDAANEGSLQFHIRLGFEQTGLLREVGRKFGRWLDLAFVQKML